MIILGQVFFFFFSIKTHCGYSLEILCRGTSNEYPQHTFFLENLKLRKLSQNSLQILFLTIDVMSFFSRNGASKSGLFCACSLVFERMRIDHEVDVYQTVKQIRINRPHFVENIVSTLFICVCFRYALMEADQLQHDEKALCRQQWLRSVNVSALSKRSWFPYIIIGHYRKKILLNRESLEYRMHRHA